MMGILKTLKRKYFKYKEHFAQHKNLKLTKKNKLVECIGIDFSKEMISVANKKNK